jgi:hypothetical protein
MAYPTPYVLKASIVPYSSLQFFGLRDIDFKADFSRIFYLGLSA